MATKNLSFWLIFYSAFGSIFFKLISEQMEQMAHNFPPKLSSAELASHKK